MKILAVSDQVVERVYPLASQGHFRDASLIVGCGDLPYAYLEYLVTVIGAPLYYVPGNHDPEYDPRRADSRAEGGANLDLRLARDRLGLTLAGFGGSIRYKPDGPNQYTQSEATLRALTLLPSLLLRRLRGRPVDILLAHSPPLGIHDSDGAHCGLKALNLLLRWARPRYLLHGHTHFYRQNLEASETQFMHTRIVNVFPYKVIEIEHA
jgi:Icc-related predicted phosphoesterase